MPRGTRRHKALDEEVNSAQWKILAFGVQGLVVWPEMIAYRYKNKFQNQNPFQHQHGLRTGGIKME